MLCWRRSYPSRTVIALLALAASCAAVKSPSAQVGKCLDGQVSYYHDALAGRPTANGETYQPDELTAAHQTLPFGSRLEVTWKDRSVIVRINDRGPDAPGAILDLSKAAAAKLGMLTAGRVRARACVLD